MGVRVNAVKAYLASIGRDGGKAKTAAKIAAARENGRLGGRPKKRKRAKRPNGQADTPRKEKL